MTLDSLLTSKPKATDDALRVVDEILELMQEQPGVARKVMAQVVVLASERVSA